MGTRNTGCRAEANLMAVAHYLEALEWQRDVVQNPHDFRRQEPAPELPGGRLALPDQQRPVVRHRRSAATAANIVAFGQIRDIIDRMRNFVDQVYVPDTIAIASFYKDWFKRGEGLGNFMTFGDFPSEGLDDPTTWMIPSGAILNRDLSTIHPVDLNDPTQVQEFVGHSWYDYSERQGIAGLHPYEGETNLNYTGPKPPYEHLDVEASYSWLKAPRWKGHAMEVGPLARVLMLYASGHEPTQELANAVLGQLDVPLDAMFSTHGTHRGAHAGNQDYR